MRYNKEALTSLTETGLWINLVGDSEGFEGETARDKRILMNLVGKTSFAWTEEKEVQREANKEDYGLSIIVFNKKEWKENYQDSYKRIRNKNHQLRRKAA